MTSCQLPAICNDSNKITSGSYSFPYDLTLKGLIKIATDILNYSFFPLFIYFYIFLFIGKLFTQNVMPYFLEKKSYKVYRMSLLQLWMEL